MIGCEDEKLYTGLLQCLNRHKDVKNTMLESKIHVINHFIQSNPKFDGGFKR